MFQDISNFEERLKLPKGFYSKLLEEDDWSFVIKLSTLFEAACTHILSIKLRAPELESSLSFLEQANTKCGKILLLKKLEAINDSQYKFLEKLASLRNKISHRIENVNFTFTAYTTSFDKNQKDAFIESFAYNWSDSVKIKDKTLSKHDFAMNNSKFVLWYTAADIFACLYVEIDVMKLKAEKEAFNFYMQNLTSCSS